ncbi:MAG TPA: type I polyketide synthase, partial [Azospirillum sp.]
MIGIGGKFPDSADLDDFWRNLEANRDLIAEVPAQRWDWRAIYGDPHREPGRTRVKWGGFLADADRFDAAFFGISAAEAEVMDPQLRLFLETVWATLEDAGYAPGALSGSRTGVFAGVATADYKDLLADARRAGTVRSAAEPFPFMVANRVSYQFNFHGPSEAIDTACSSSLIAIHRAIESLRNGHCDLAIAGGVNVLASPRITVASSRAGMLSEDGRCMTFDQRANGYVRSEGVAMLLLKPLRRAVADNDRIHGIIRASGENHGGRAPSPTAPNASAQRQLLVDVYSRAGIDPRGVGYIEAHGTGTALGDPVEVNGLKAAFADLYRLRRLDPPAAPTCALGSVKANIGHLEAAAGATGIIKVLLMLRHGKIPGNPHLCTPNPYLDLDGTPFHLIGATRDWERPRDADGRPLPRRAGVSSFGVGGSNAHVVVEEYLGPARRPATVPGGPALIVLSARDEPALRRSAERLARFIGAEGASLSLRDVAYTLQVGREAMPERLAFQAATLDEAERTLRAYAEGAAPVQGLHLGRAPEHDDALAAFSADEDMAATLDAWMAKGKHDKLLAAWAGGLPVDWKRLYAGDAPARIGLPTYPFARERHWIPTDEPALASSAEDSADEVLVFEETWVDTPPAGGPGPSVADRPLGTILCIVSAPDERQAIAAQIAARDPHARVVFAEAGDADAFGRVGGRADAVLYLAPLEDPRLIGDVAPVLRLIQGMAAAGERPRRLILCGAHADAVEQCHLDAWVAFERSLAPVLPDTEVVAVFGDRATAGTPSAWMPRLLAELGEARLRSVRYQGQRRQTLAVRPAALAPTGGSPLRQGGTYLITGGCGGLGMIFAEHLARSCAANLLLTGRSPLDADRQALLQRLRDLGAQALYVPADAAD